MSKISLTLKKLSLKLLVCYQAINILLQKYKMGFILENNQAQICGQNFLKNVA